MQTALDPHPSDIAPSSARFISDVEIVIFDGFSLPGIAAIMEIFHRANALAHAQPGMHSYYNVSLLSSSGGTIVSSSSVRVGTDEMIALPATQSTNLLFIAGGAGAQRAAHDGHLANWVRQRHAMSAVVCPIAEGGLILDAIGLSGRYNVPLSDPVNVAETHWQDHSRTTANAIRTALQVPKDEPGTHLAPQLVRTPARSTRDGADAAALRSLQSHRISDKIMASARWLEENADRPITIELAAEVAAMSERNFLRRFKTEIGMTPSDYLQRVRLELSCRMLIESQLPVDKIARRCGIGSGGQLAKLLKKHLSVTPTDYRFSHGDLEKALVRASEAEDAELVQTCSPLVCL